MYALRIVLSQRTLSKIKNSKMFNTISHHPSSSTGNSRILSSSSGANLTINAINNNSILYNNSISIPFSHPVADSAHHHVSSTSSNNTNWLDDDDQQQDDQNNEVENEEEEVPNISLAHSVGQIQNQNQKRKAVRKKKRSFIWHLVQVFPDPETAEAFIRQNKTLAVHRKNVDAAVRDPIYA